METIQNLNKMLFSKIFPAPSIKSRADVLENIDEWKSLYARWKGRRLTDLTDYPFVSHTLSPFAPARRALPMLNLALISSAGAYIDGTEPFDTESADGDFSFREIPIEIEAEDLKFSARGYDPTAVKADLNSLIPIQRLVDYQNNGVIGSLNPAWLSFCGYIPDAARFVEETIPQMVERIKRYEVQSALLVPASKLCQQSIGLLARAIEKEGIPTMMIATEREVADKVHPPRCGFYKGEFGATVGAPNFREFQMRVLDQSLRWIESLDQPTVQKLTVELESKVEAERGER